MLTQHRNVCVVLAAAAWAATAAAVIDGGDFGRGAAVQIVLAASLATAALSEALLSLALSPARQATVSDPSPVSAVRRLNWPGGVALVAVLLGPAAGAALGTSWHTSLFTTLALVCAAASIVAYRLAPRGGMRRAPGLMPPPRIPSTSRFVSM